MKKKEKVNKIQIKRAHKIHVCSLERGFFFLEEFCLIWFKSWDFIFIFIKFIINNPASVKRVFINKSVVRLTTVIKKLLLHYYTKKKCYLPPE